MIAVFDNTEKDIIPAAFLGEAAKIASGQPLSPGSLGRTRAFIKVQDGCENRCTYCLTTLVRGSGWSRSADEIVAEIRELTEAGYQEAVLSGVHLGSYGAHRGENNGLKRLIRRILRETPLPRLRLSSLEPWDLAPDFFDLWADARLCPHLHLPLQSGSDAVLRRMARHTTKASFSALIAAARERIPDLAVTTDVMVGFPGETETEFEESLSYIEGSGLSRLHVFHYSRRPGTRAAAFSDQVPLAVKKERHQLMSTLSDQLYRTFLAEQIGREVPVLWESGKRLGGGLTCWSGHTPNYLPVITRSTTDLTNSIRLTGLIEGTGSALTGIIIE